MIKTAEEILKPYECDIHSFYHHSDVLKAMEEYAFQQPVPQQTGGYSLQQVVEAWDAGFDRGTYEACDIDELVVPKEKETYLASLQIAPSDAIVFVEWIKNIYSWGNIADKWYLHEDTDIEYTTSELYEIFKQRTTTT